LITVARTAAVGASLPLDAGATNDEVCPQADLAGVREIGRATRLATTTETPQTAEGLKF
jgi:hypothetical protein